MLAINGTPVLRNFGHISPLAGSPYFFFLFNGDRTKTFQKVYPLGAITIQIQFWLGPHLAKGQRIGIH